MDMLVNGSTGQVTVRYMDNGMEKTASEHLQLPADTTEKQMKQDRQRKSDSALQQLAGR